jgi:hypothetical protein
MCCFAFFGSPRLPLVVAVSSVYGLFNGATRYTSFSVSPIATSGATIRPGQPVTGFTGFHVLDSLYGTGVSFAVGTAQEQSSGSTDIAYVVGFWCSTAGTNGCEGQKQGGNFSLLGVTIPSTAENDVRSPGSVVMNASLPFPFWDDGRCE